MTTSRLLRYALSISAAAYLGGCSGLPAAPGGPAAVAPATSRSPRSGGGSWMAAGASTKDLLYVTNGATVNVYSYPQGELEGQLMGFSSASGTCTDSNANVYIADFNENTIAEYAHGGTEPIRALSVPGSGPSSCAVDPGSGDLAVAVAGTVTGVGADLAIYRKAKGRPKIFADPAISAYAYCAYDKDGNLFVDGTPARGYGYDFELAELPRQAKSLEAVDLEGGVSWEGGLQWDGQYLVVGQPVRPEIQRYLISGVYGTFVGTTVLSGAYDAVQFILSGKKTIVVNLYYYDRYITKWDVLVFNYPAGGSQTQEILDSGTPVGSVALSRGHK
jgi:hypothetical protein